MSATDETPARRVEPLEVGKGYEEVPKKEQKDEVVESSVTKTANAMLALRYYIIRTVGCPVPGLPSFVPIIGGRTIIELVAAAATIGLGLVLTGGSGRGADYLGAVTILLSMRYNIMTLLFGISFERAIFWHKVMAVTATIATGLHASGKGANSTGVGIIACMSVASAVYFVRPYWFELFYYVHILCYIAIIPMIMMHFSAQYFTYACAFWILDLILRYVITSNKVTMSAQILPGDVIRLKCKKTFNYHPGQYCFLLVPDVQKIEFHPFSISSAPHEEFVTFHIRVLGDWTKKLKEHIEKKAEEAKTEAIDLTVCVEGPYGSHQINLENPKYEVMLLISGGIGITPLHSVQQDLIHQVTNGRAMRKVVFVWSVKDRAMVDAMHHHHKGNPDAYLPLSFQPEVAPAPRFKAAHHSPNTVNPAAVEEGKNRDDIQELSSNYVFFNEFYLTQVRDAKEFDDADIHPDVQKWLKFGRPKLDSLFTDVANLCKAEGIKRVGVCVCGPQRMVDDVKDLCHGTQLKFSQETVRFDCHSEVFDF